MNGGPEKKPQKMARSSIACARCRRSKVKCVNDGPNTTCKACSQTSRECTYPASGTPAPKRTEATGIKQEEGESKKRVRKVEDSGRRNSARVEDALDSPILTKKVWDQLYDVFKLHFSTEMPFLHPPTFRHRMRLASYPRDPSASPAELQEGRLLLLGVLTLTARFCPDLVAHHAQSGRPVNPIDASEYYATALKSAFSPTGTNLTTPSLDGIQALLMLGLYEWGQSRGSSAWVYVGIATRLAQSMGLEYEDDPEQSVSGPTNSSSSASTTGPRDQPMEKEVRRRTLWSCFIMDRMFSAGKHRPKMIAVDRLKVHLPASDDSFLFVRASQTGMLNCPSSAQDDGVLSHYIRLVEIFGRFSEYSYAGGRRVEKPKDCPPWDETTRFYKLRKELEEFKSSLPPFLSFTDANLAAHIEQRRNATTYATMHTLYSLCVIMLHREYIPFIPLRCKKPQGPLDEPTLPPEKFPEPPGFWEDSAARMFRAARDIVAIVRTCQDDNALPESPQICFAVWQAAFVCLYALHYPHMDTEQYLLGPPSPGAASIEDSSSRGYNTVTVKILKDMIPRLAMASLYVKKLRQMNDVYQKNKLEYENRFKQKFVFSNGGLEQYKLLEKELKEFGSLEDENAASEGSDPSRSRASTNDPAQGSMNGEPMQGVEAAQTPRSNGTWQAINGTNQSHESEERGAYNQGANLRYSQSYHQSPGQHSNPPSLINSNGDSTSGLNSPYAQNPPQHYGAMQPQNQMPMPPPRVGGSPFPSTSEGNAQWLHGLEQVSMGGTQLDNFMQEDMGMSWSVPSDGFQGFFETIGPHRPYPMYHPNY